MLARLLVLCLVLVGFAVIAFLANAEVLDVPIRQALIAGLVVASGWLVAFLSQDWNRDRQRREMQTDVQLALRAEIQDCWETFTWRDRDTRAFGRGVQAQILAGGDGEGAFHPFIVRDAKMIVFEAMKDRLHHLPSEVVDEVVQFYCQLADLQAFADQMMGEEFRALTSERRSGAYGHYIQMTVECESRARDALTMLNYSLGVWDDAGSVSVAAQRQAQQDAARKSLRAWISKTDRDQADRLTDAAL
ncbi:hypothetical protein NBRC116594_37740 [Shimia sp. NS0008-38b]|uniref:hypothetical protein n=1 Tax=Shimia sp. NS0008-38b TaxID=3127653 RepID=UPI00310C540F